MTDIATTAALQVQIRALIDGWRRDIAESRRLEETADDVAQQRYHRGYADALDRSMQALKLLTDAP